uniref:Nose resistant to fluoxetine protein 6 n=1 Tax=Anisakis simplex TaxID=6269 RepID=A0A0M3JDZ6_ANISI
LRSRRVVLCAESQSGRALAVGFACVGGAAERFRGRSRRAVLRPVNSLLSWRAWIPLSRITFCAYLIHPILLQIYNLSRPHPFHFTTVYQMFYLFAVAVTMAYFVGFLLSLAVEVPISNVETLAINTVTGKIGGRPKSAAQYPPISEKPGKNDIVETCADDADARNGAAGLERVELKLLLSDASRNVN